MLRKFIWWGVTFGLSFLIQSWGWTTQGTAFLCIRLVIAGLILVVGILMCLFAGKGLAEKIVAPVPIALAGAKALGIVLLATWVAAKLFAVEFTVAYQIMAFSQCLCGSSKKEDD